MIYSFSYDIMRLYSLLLAAAVNYQDLLQNLNLETLFARTDATDIAGYYMYPTVAATYDGAGTMCWVSQRDLFSVKSQQVNLDEVFNLLNLTKDSSDADSQIWVRIVKAKYIEKPIDITGFAPKAATNYQIIGIDELVPERMTEDVGVVLQKTKDGYKYTLIKKSASRRTICMEPTPFGRSKRERTVLDLLRKSLVKEVARLKDEIQFDNDHYSRLIGVSQTLQNGVIDKIPRIDIGLSKNITEEISELTTMSKSVEKLFKGIEEPLSLAELSVAHTELIHAFRSVKSKIAAPFSAPLMLMTPDIASALPRGSQIGTLNSNTDMIVYVKEIERTPDHSMSVPNATASTFDFTDGKESSVRTTDITSKPNNDTDTWHFINAKKWWAGAMAWASGLNMFIRIVNATWGPLPIALSCMIIFNFWVNIIQCILLCSVQYKKRELRMPYARKITGFFRKKDTQSDSQPVPTAPPPPPVRRRNSRVLFSPTTDSPPPRRPIVRKTTTTEIIEETIPLQTDVYQKRKAPREPPPKYRRSDVPLYLYVLL
jgi:hypothetical protein